ncbi:hypothetical protein BKA62DRAFT_634306 [Auriculariales sp. MPI-PUGE-AT-0066]|nr:hypothetical protein BKA62DRAFT_634306 [Auriculariales sp. MPI-PUGE-AT-0066]
MHILVFGASRNVGYLTATRLLAKGETVTLVVRSAATFDNDAAIQEHIKSGRAHVAVGDALKEDDVRRVIGANTFDFIVFSIGAAIQMAWPKPVIKPADLCASSMNNLLAVLYSSPAEIKATKLVVISSSGLGRKGHDVLPLVMKPLYGWGLEVPHVDKINMERALGRAAGHADWGEDATSEAAGVDAEPWLNVAVIRPAFLTDGDCNADKNKPGKEPYRIGEYLRGAYTISRKDIAHFVVEEAIKDFAKYKDRAVDVGY